MHVYKAWKAQAICLPTYVIPAVWVKLVTHTTHAWRDGVEADDIPTKKPAAPARIVLFECRIFMHVGDKLLYYVRMVVLAHISVLW